MKKLCFYLVLSLFTSSIFAQRGLEIGPRIFPHFSSIIVQQDRQSWDKNIRTNGMDWGIEIGYSTRITRSVRSGVYFSETGDAFVRDNVYYSRKVNYMEIPMHFKFITDPFYVYMFSFYIGPQLKMRTTAYHHYIDFGNQKTALKYARDHKDLSMPSVEEKMNYAELYDINFRNTENLYQRYSLDLSLGLGFDYPLGAYILFNSYIKFDYALFNIENRKYEIKFERFWSNHWTRTFERNKARNRDIGIMMGITLILPKRR